MGWGKSAMGREVQHLTTLEGGSAVELIVTRLQLDSASVRALIQLGAVWSAAVAPLPPPAARRYEWRFAYCARGGAIARFRFAARLGSSRASPPHRPR
jgi:hypothetical protein